MIFLTFGLCLFSTAAYAGSDSSSEEDSAVFQVTSGIEEDSEKAEVTFDDSRVISGTAENGTELTISVYLKSSSGKLKEKDSFVTKVGASGIFSETINLYLGENLVEIQGDRDGDQSSQEVLIKRKSEKIRTELEEDIALPGDAF